jgi:hypothetical protein
MKRQWGAVILESLAFHGLGRIGVRPSLSSESLQALEFIPPEPIWRFRAE